MSDASGSAYYYENGAREEEDSSAYEPQLQSWSGYGHMPMHPEHFPAPPHAAQASYARLPQGAYTQQHYDLAPVHLCAAWYAAQGSAGYAYETMDPAPAPTAVFAPLQPHNTKTRESGRSSVASIDAPYLVEVGYAQHHHDQHTYTYYHDPRGHYAPPEDQPHAETYAIGNDWQRLSIMPPIPESALSRSSTLANALGGITLKLDSPTPLSWSTHSQTTWPTPPVSVDNALPAPGSEVNESKAVNNITFIHETGIIDSTTPSTSSRARVSDSPVEVELQPRRKRTRGPNKGPRKDPGFLACYFCRGRKIGCTPPADDSEDRRCEQCAKRDLACESPTISRRGQRAHKRKDLDWSGVSTRHHVALGRILLPTDVEDAQLEASTRVFYSSADRDARYDTIRIPAD